MYPWIPNKTRICSVTIAGASLAGVNLASGQLKAVGGRGAPITVKQFLEGKPFPISYHIVLRRGVRNSCSSLKFNGNFNFSKSSRSVEVRGLPCSQWPVARWATKTRTSKYLEVPQSL